VRCPGCDEFVEVSESICVETESSTDLDVTPSSDEADDGAVSLLPGHQTAAGDTVMLEAVEVAEAIDGEQPVEVSEVIEDPPVIETAQPRPAETAPDAAAEEVDTRFKSSREREETEMDMTPMVDVTFLLLIFFMVTAAFALQKSIEVPKPSDDQPSENVVEKDPDDNPDFVTVRVDEYNTYNVTTVDWEEEAPSVQDLHIHLRRARDGDSTGTVPTKLLVEAHGEALHGKVVAALDAGTATGFEEVQLTTVEED
jgi:biopolymer transport protein ExbD